MELSDEITINAPQARVYEALNDPEILKQCIPGCDELTKHSDTELAAKVVLKIGPVKAKFSGDVVLDTAGAPDGPETTILRYKAKADIGGKLAQLGSRLVQSTAKKLAGKFFKSFADVVNDDTTA